MKKLLVTGAAGRLGRALCAAAAGRYRVVGFDLNAPEPAGHVEAVAGDLRDLEALTRAAKGCDAIVHTGALLDRFIGTRPRSEFFEINVTGSDYVFQAAVDNGVPKVVYSSSTEVYGTRWEDFGAALITVEHPVAPETIYALTKHLTEAIAHSYAKRHGIRAAGLRYMTFNEKPPETLGLGLVARYLWVRDIAEANFACVESERYEDEIFLIGPDTPLTQADVVEAVWNPAAVLERHWPGSVALLERAGVKIKVNDLYPVVSISKARRLLDWRPAYTFASYLRHLETQL